MWFSYTTMKLLLSLLLVFSFRIKTSLLQNVFECGVSQIKNELILHGHSTVPGEWPWHVAIYQILEGKETYICGGTLVTKLHVITTKHCVTYPKILADEFSVRLGVFHLNSTNRKIQNLTVSKIHTVDDNSLQNLRNDIAIMELARAVDLNKYVQPACISISEVLTGQFGTVIGWGHYKSDKISNVLRSVRMPVIDENMCIESDQAAFGWTLDEGFFCAGYTNGTTICNGDGGGGVFFKENGAWHLGGISSFTAKREDGTGDHLCYRKGYGGFTKIHTYLAWIRSVTKLNLPIHKDVCVSNGIDVNANNVNLLPRDCGINNIKRSVQRNDADLLEFPWIAILRYEKGTEIDSSSVGALVHKRYVLATASSTVPGSAPYQVRLGEHTIGRFRDCNEDTCAPPARDYEIECIIRHPNATYSNNFWVNDIALIRLDRDVKFEVHIQPVCLPVTESLRNLVLTQYLVTGWKLYHSANPLTLAKTTVPNIQINCNDTQHYTDNSPHNILCIGQSAACFMSVGSPLGEYANYNGKRFVQFGLFLYDVHCKHSVFLSTARYLDWILVNINP